jgi:hypothetical protein
MDHNLISPFQVQMNNIMINEAPVMMLCRNRLAKDIPTDAHSILITKPDLIIPLQLNGIMSFFQTRCPTEYELQNPDKFTHITMTYESPVWDPYSDEYARLEDECRTQLDHLPPDHDCMIDKASSQQHSELNTKLIQLAFQSTTSVRRKGTVSPGEGNSQALEHWTGTGKEFN